MKNYISKLVYILIIIISFTMPTITYAAPTGGPVDASSGSSGGGTYSEDSFITGKSSEMSNMAAKLVGKQIYVYQIVGSAVALCMIMGLGIKYVTSSVEEKAEIKKHAVVFVVGAILVFGAVNIVALVQNGLKDI